VTLPLKSPLKIVLSSKVKEIQEIVLSNGYQKFRKKEQQVLSPQQMTNFCNSK
jgi:shikimate kinase